MPYLPFLIIVACAIFFHRAAEFENESSLLWTGLSVVISVLTWFVFLNMAISMRSPIFRTTGKALERSFP